MNGDRTTRSFGTRRTVVAASAVVAVLLSACGSSYRASSASGRPNAGQVLVYDGGGAWGAAQRTAYFEPFEKATGIQVVPVTADTPTAMESAIQNGSPSMDVIDLDPFAYAAWDQEKLLQPIDYSAWTTVNVADFKPYPTEPDGVPSLIYATQIAWNQSLTKAPLTSWADFFNASKFPGKRSMGDGGYPTDGIYEAALLADGVNPARLYPLDIDKAFQKLSQLKPDILKFWESGSESVQLLGSGQVSTMAAFNGRIATLEQQDKNIQSTWNDAIVTNDYWVIPKGAKDTTNAQKFIEFASRPDRQAAFAEAITYAPTNEKAYDDIPADRQALLPTAPENRDKVIVLDNQFWNSNSGNGQPWAQAILNRFQNWLSQ